ncbi:MAG TPA: hypothetical protein VGI43_17505 [Mucilaginibacter sp.]|jgi:hypothetical protein
MTENFYHYPDDTVFHGSSEYPDGYLFSYARALTTENEKILKLKERLNGYYVNGLASVEHPFMTAILTCVGLEVLGQVFLGFDSEGKTIQSNTILIYEMLDQQLQQPLSTTFKSNYNLNRNPQGQTTDYTISFSSYAHILRKGLRNSFTHNYRSLGVFLGEGEIIDVHENEGFMVVNPTLFKQQFNACYENCFSQAISNSIPSYRQNALRYFELLIR